MSKEDDLLARELGKLGSFGGGIGGGAAGAQGGSLGASLAARFLPTEHCRMEVSVSRDAATVLAGLASFLAGEGRIADEQEAARRFRSCHVSWDPVSSG